MLAVHGRGGAVRGLRLREAAAGEERQRVPAVRLQHANRWGGDGGGDRVCVRVCVCVCVWRKRRKRKEKVEIRMVYF